MSRVNYREIQLRNAKRAWAADSTAAASVHSPRPPKCRLSLTGWCMTHACWSSLCVKHAREANLTPAQRKSREIARKMGNVIRQPNRETITVGITIPRAWMVRLNDEAARLNTSPKTLLKSFIPDRFKED